MSAFLRRRVTMGVMLAALASPALAQNARDAAARQAEQIQRRQAEQERLRQLETLDRRAPAGAAPVAPEATVSVRGTPCIDVKTIVVSGATLVPAPDIRKAVSVWEGRCLGLAEINDVLKALTFLYVERGYIASRAYLPEQDVSDGSLDIGIIEGQLEGITLNGAVVPSGEIATAFPGMVGKPVNLRSIEQGLDQINRLRSRNVAIALEAGKEQGGSVLGVTVEKKKPWSLAFSVDNLGAGATGIFQSGVDVGIDNLFGFNDQWSLGYQRSMDRQPLYFSGNRPNSDSVTAGFSVPYGFWTAGFDGSWSRYRSSVEGNNSIIDTSGGSLLLSPWVSRVIHRDQVSKTWATGRFTWKQTDNFILGDKVDTNSRTLAIASAELGHSRRLGGGELSASLGFHRGLDILGAFDDGTASDGSPKGQFSKATFSLAWLRPFDLKNGTVLYYNTVLSGQWSPDSLFSSEQMALGGYSTVRGVREAVLYSNTALFWRNELAFLLPPPTNPGVARVIGRFEPYLALDYGNADDDPTKNSLGGAMTGAAVGLRNRGGRFAFDVSYTDLLSVPKLSDGSRPAHGLAQARLSVAF